jgi:hypothetical protein
MNRSKLVMELCNILVDTFDNTGIKDTPENYTVYVQDFAQEHNMKIFGEQIVEANAGWKTTGFEFNNKEAEMFFKLKFGKIEVS